LKLSLRPKLLEGLWGDGEREGSRGRPYFPFKADNFWVIGLRIPKATGSIPLRRLAERAEDFPKYRFA
jgi:hypothetical protein